MIVHQSKHTSRRYAIRHPLLTPEFYRRTPQHRTDEVRALYIPQARPASPEVILDTSHNIRDQIFGPFSTRCIHFAIGFHMYIPNAQGILLLGENIIATHLMRQHYLLEYGALVPDTIYGDALIFGTGSANRDYSVPYEIVEQLIHLYEKI